MVKEYVNSRTEVRLDYQSLILFKNGRTSLHYAGEIKPGAAHFPDEDANLIGILIDYGGQTELQTYEVRVIEKLTFKFRMPKLVCI